MKKILSIILGAIICAQAFGQINVDAGYLNSRYHYGEDGYSFNISGSGAFVGVSTDIPSTNYDQFAFSPGLRFNIVDYDLGDSVNAVQYFVSVPLHVKYLQPVNRGIDAFLSVGPTVICTLGGKAKMSYGGLSYHETVEGGDFDVAFGLAGGVVLTDNVRVLCGYDFGLLNQSGEKDYRETRNIFHFGIGYMF